MSRPLRPGSGGPQGWLVVVEDEGGKHGERGVAVVSYFAPKKA